MRVLAVACFVMMLGASAQNAMAYDTFIPLGFGYSTANGDPAQLTARERATISQTDIYETDIYQRQLRARQTDSRMQRFLNDRNADGTDYSPNY
jgi:hypothetical protein